MKFCTLFTLSVLFLHFVFVLALSLSFFHRFDFFFLLLHRLRSEINVIGSSYLVDCSKYEIRIHMIMPNVVMFTLRACSNVQIDCFNLTLFVFMVHFVNSVFFLVLFCFSDALSVSQFVVRNIPKFQLVNLLRHIRKITQYIIAACDCFILVCTQFVQVSKRAGRNMTTVIEREAENLWD